MAADDIDTDDSPEPNVNASAQASGLSADSLFDLIGTP
jgi:hypothetical protein